MQQISRGRSRPVGSAPRDVERSSVEFRPNESRRAGCSAAPARRPFLGDGGLFASANGEKLKAVSGMVQRTCSIATSFVTGSAACAGIRRLGDSWYEPLIPGHTKTILYRLYNPASTG